MFKKLILSAATALAGVCVFAMLAAADTTGFAAGDVLNIRQVPAMDAKVLGELYLADPVTVIATEGSWCKVRYNDQIGYVHKDLIVFDRSQVPEPVPAVVEEVRSVPASTSTSTATSPKKSTASGNSSAKSAPAPAAKSNGSSVGQQIVSCAKNYIGVPYVWGGSSPSGFDCSGFVQYVYRQFGISLPRTTYSQVAMGRSVSRSELQPGDLVFFRSAGHVGIYVGNETYIHAPQTGRTISIDNMAGRSLYAARRIV
ncbi:MAG: SH3 domain-containing C40 family peptidase [Clostridia bacterium]|nr:SH3 domain-containing C40 family peptidase [Clostridia bacterium]